MINHLSYVQHFRGLTVLSLDCENGKGVVIIKLKRGQSEVDIIAALKGEAQFLSRVCLTAYKMRASM